MSLVDRGSPSGVLFAVRQSWVYRFMLNDGTTLDVIADRDDSDLRGAVLAHTGADKIEGVARIAPDDRRTPEVQNANAQRTSSSGSLPSSGSSGG